METLWYQLTQVHLEKMAIKTERKRERVSDVNIQYRLTSLLVAVVIVAVLTVDA